MGLAKKLILVWASLSLLSACHKDLGPQSVTGKQVVPDSNAVIIVNEGNFQWGNASLGQYNPDLNLYEDGLFREANAEALGDVLQEAHKIGDRYYLVMNGSNELIICDSEWEVQKRVAGQSAPYRLYFWQGKICLSDYYQSKLWILDLEGNLQSEISLSGAPQALLSWQGDLVLSHQRKLEFLESANGSAASLASFNSDIQAVLTYEDQLFIALADDRLLQWEHPDSNLKVVDTLDILASALRPGSNGFYSYDGDSIYRHQAALNFRGQAICAIATDNFYGLDWEEKSDALFLFDAKQYVAPHQVWRIDAQNGEVLNEFEAGALPNGLLKDWD
jgi:hypothetical protein